MSAPSIWRPVHVRAGDVVCLPTKAGIESGNVLLLWSSGRITPLDFFPVTPLSELRVTREHGVIEVTHWTTTIELLSISPPPRPMTETERRYEADVAAFRVFCQINGYANDDRGLKSWIMACAHARRGAAL